MDSVGNAYVTGFTASTEATFPVTVGPDLTHNGGSIFGGDAFVAKVNPMGTALLYAGYIGGSGWDFGNGIAVDAAGNAYVIGWTESTQGTFPVTVGPDLTFNGDEEVFVAKIGASPCTLILELSHSPGTLTMNVQLGTLAPARWDVWLFSILGVHNLWMAPIPRIDPAVSFPVSFPFPNLGNIGILTTLGDESGVICADWQTGNTSGSGASIQQLEEMLSRSGIPSK